ncbi:MAG TPA: sigma-70 family RNA polymerase sigma factor [Cyclobacteriaceae bacterium]|nr:sigma-70 family RNA polymerase sigma factor [Cyclobacteriaceae bacterium]
MSIIEHIRSGGKEALAKVYLDYRKEFIGWAFKKFKCPTATAEDAWQQAIIVLYENVVSGRLLSLSSSEKTYLFAIGKNKLREANRREMKIRPLGDFDADEFDLPVDQSPTEPFEQRALDKAVASLHLLGEPCKSLLIEFYYHHRSMVQIVNSLGYKNEATAKSQKYKCLARLRKKFQEITQGSTVQ